MIPATLRKIALALPDTSEQPHHGFPSFRTKNKIFATVPDDTHIHVMLDEDDIRSAVTTHDCCEEMYWGKRLSAVRVDLTTATQALISDLLLDAWERIHEA
ncbi:MAG: hypothetical protein ACI841_001756 [Planctomycetota bacterium]|jgi:hypothetical protein